MIFAENFSRNFGSSLKNTDLRYCLNKILLDNISHSRRFLDKVDRDQENRRSLKIQSNSREMRPVIYNSLASNSDRLPGFDLVQAGPTG